MYEETPNSNEKPFLELDFSSTQNSFTPGPLHSNLNARIDKTLFGEDLTDKYIPQESTIVHSKVKRKGITTIKIIKPRLDDTTISGYKEYMKGMLHRFIF